MKFVDLDARALAREVLEAARPHAREALDHIHDARARWIRLQADVDATLAAMDGAEVGLRQALLEDLREVLPARKAAILSAVESKVSCEAKAAFEAALEVALRAAFLLAKALA
jgi:hypothetical protein